MNLPDYQSLMAPVLRQLADGHEHASRDMAAAIAADLRLSNEDLALMLPSGRMTVWRSRVHWATQYLYQARAIDRTRRGVFAINERGQALLVEHPNHVGNAQLDQFQEFRDFKTRARGGTSNPAKPAPAAGPRGAATPGDELATPVERVASAAAEVNDSVAAALLTRVNEQPPEFLERVVLDLLVAMGYAGALGGAQHLGKSGDEGVDGVLSQDALGLDRIFVQAKRYASGRTVGRPDIQSFVGALHGAQASRGVYITTSQFSRDAVDYADRVPQRVILIDGEDLTRLMVKHGVGVQVEQTVVLNRIDEDFFEL